MKSETQALHLSRIMQNHLHNPQYELSLPFVKIRRSTLNKLSVNDILLLEMDILEFILFKEDIIYADLTLHQIEGKHVLVIKHVHHKKIVANESPKYKTVKLSFGKYFIKSLEVGKSLALTPFELEKITVISDEKKIAAGSLVNVDHTLAVKINMLF